MPTKTTSTLVETKIMISECNDQPFQGTQTRIDIDLERCMCDNTFEYHQVVALDTWNVCHNLGKKPSVVVTDDSKKLVIANVEHIDDEVLLIRFNAPFTGWAFLN